MYVQFTSCVYGGGLTIHTGVTGFTPFSTRMYYNRSLADSDLFPIFTQSIHSIVAYQMFEKCGLSDLNGCFIQYFSKVYGKICVGFKAFS